MKSSCIQHPPQDRLLVIRDWQIRYCDGNHCAAALLSFLEYWHNVRLDMQQKAHDANDTAVKHGDPSTQDESLFQFHTDEQLRAGLLGLYGTKKIREARRLLVEKSAVTEHANPNPRYIFDKTLFFLFHPEAINAWLAQQAGPSSPGSDLSDQDGLNATSSGNNADGDGTAADGDGKSAIGVGLNAASYTEITTETTSEITSEISKKKPCTEIVVDEKKGAPVPEHTASAAPSTTKASDAVVEKVKPKKAKTSPPWKKTSPYPIPEDWQPSEACLIRLEGQGIPREFAKSLVNEFVLFWRGCEICRPGWDSTFFKRAENQWKYHQAKTPASGQTLNRGGVGNSKQANYDYRSNHETSHRNNQPERLSAAEKTRRIGLRTLADSGNLDAQRALLKLERGNNTLDLHGRDIPAQVVLEVGPTGNRQQRIPNVAPGPCWDEPTPDRSGASTVY